MNIATIGRTFAKRLTGTARAYVAHFGRRGSTPPPGGQGDLASFYKKSVTHPIKGDLDIKSAYSHPLIDTELAAKLADFFAENWIQFKDSYSLLNVGVGFNVPPNWLTFFRDVLKYDCIASLEIWQPYIHAWRYHFDFPVWQADVREIDTLLPPKSVDTVLWAQGPEHLHPEEVLPTYLKIKRVARYCIVFVTPWGSAYDYQDEINHNPFEKHLIHGPDPHIYERTDLTILTFGRKGTPSAFMLAYEFLGGKIINP